MSRLNKFPGSELISGVFDVHPPTILLPLSCEVVLGSLFHLVILYNKDMDSLDRYDNVITKDVTISGVIFVSFVL